MQTSEEPNLVSQFLWTHDKVREIFQHYRLWPTFSGAVENQKGGGTGSLPVILWPEQRAVFKAPNVPLRKRKFGEVEDRESFGNSSESGNDAAAIHVSSDTEEGSSAKRSRQADGTFSLWRMVAWGSTLMSLNRLPNISPSSQTSDHSKANTSISYSKQPSFSECRSLGFAHLHSRGYFVGPGDVYGGDYCIYANGDPSNTHSLATVRVTDSPSIAAKDLLAFTRMQNHVAKSAMFIFTDADTANQPTVHTLMFNFVATSERL